MNSRPDPSIAVVGMSCRYAGAQSPQELWELLMRRECTTTPVPGDRWDTTQPLDPDLDVLGVGSFLPDVTGFDATFFRMSPREADNVDPQQRLALELAWQALEDAGIVAKSLRDSRVGVYFGAGGIDYEHIGWDVGAPVNQHTAPGLALDMMAERISYFMGLRGPSLTVQTGCSSGLVALHLACQALAAREIEAAIVGGINLILDPWGFRNLGHFGALSADGVCRPYSALANGFVRGEGGGVVLLKRADEVAPGEPCHGLIVATGVNNDGGGDSIAAPSPEGQAALYRTIYSAHPELLDRLCYVEGHGTGTKVGDPAELKALGAEVATRRSESSPLPVGSLKGNIGHLEAGSGIAGLVKCLASLERGQVPPTLTTAELNPAIDFAALNVRVLQEPFELPTNEPAYLGINSFGWGGTNAHVVVRSADRARVISAAPTSTGPIVLPISAHCDEALRTRARDLAETVASRPDDLARIASTLAWHRDALLDRTTVIATSASDAADKLTAFAEAQDDIADVMTGRAAEVGRTCFVFPGQGSQWRGMGVDLMSESAVFAQTMDECAAALLPEVDWDLREALRGQIELDWEAPEVVQPILWAMALGIFRLWRQAGICPDVVVGHSQGEIAAATAAGILTVEDGAKVVARRAKILKCLTGKGHMLFVGASAEETQKQLVGFESSISVAVINSPTSCVVSGEKDSVLVLKELLDIDGIYCKLVKVNYASHSPQVDAVVDDITAALADISPRPAQIPMVSTVTATPVSGPELDGAYWTANLRSPVRFGETMAAQMRNGVTHVIEVSSHPLLRQPLEEVAETQEQSAVILTSMEREAGQLRDVLAAHCQAWTRGLPALGLVQDLGATSLPVYPWRREHRWLHGSGRVNTTDAPMLPSRTEQGTWVGRPQLTEAAMPWVRDHQVTGTVVMPGTGIIDIALRGSIERMEQRHTMLRQIEFLSDLTFGEEPIVAEVAWREEDAGCAAFELSEYDALSGAWGTVSRCRLSNEGPEELIDFPEWMTELAPMEPAEVYQRAADRGIEYGPTFRAIQKLWHVGSESLALCTVPPDTPLQAFAHRLHPALMDSTLQAALPAVTHDGPVVPVAIDALYLSPEIGLHPITTVFSYARVEGDLIDIDIYDENRQVISQVRGLRMQVLDGGSSTTLDKAFRISWEATPLPETTVEDEVAVVDTPASAARAAALRDALSAQGTSVVDASAASIVVFIAPDREAGVESQRDALTRLAEVVRAASTQAPAPHLVVITADAQADAEPDAGAALFWGFSRVIRNEYSELSVRIVDVAAGADGISQVVAEIMHGGPEDEVRWVDDERQAAVICDAHLVDQAEHPGWQDWATRREPFQLVTDRVGRWDGLKFRTMRRRALAPHEVEVEMQASALNFADVLKAMGRYPGEDRKVLALGLDAAGVVARVGAEVTPSLVGRRVITCAGEGAFSSHLIVPVEHVHQIPEGMSFEEAASLPMVMVTAWESLVRVGQLSEGETVLIHSAAGGLGLAAIEIAFSRGATVIATASTPEKREYLRSRGVGYVFQSRNLEWVEPVRELTGGRGVDVILNSLTGRAIDEGMALLADGGRFVEVGKKDIYSDRSISMGLLRRGVGLASVDVARLMYERPVTFAKVLAESWEQVQAGRIRPPALVLRSYAETPRALREMSAGSHVGKFVISDPATVNVLEPNPLHEGRLRADGCYVISGGLGALALSLGREMAQRGAGHIALLARRGPTPDEQSRIDEITAAGATVYLRQADITDEAAVRRAWQGLPPVRGIVHTAGILEDATIQNVTPQQIARVLDPKVLGAEVLDRVSQDEPLEMFVLFSSAAGMLGNPGQGAYAAANTYLDALARRRRSRGFAALSVAWGAFDKIGLAAADAIRGARLSSFGMLSFEPTEGWEALFSFLEKGESEVAFAPLDREQFFISYPQRAQLHTMSSLADFGGHSGGSGGRVAEKLLALGEDERVAAAAEEVRRLVGQVLQLDPAQAGDDIPFKSLGLDSLMGIELRNRLESAFGMPLPATLLWTYSTTKKLAEELVARVTAAHEAETVEAVNA
ncbi:SDR family NAD(P)-dependent oxidoreductase [Luteococcus sp.]|uniref:SDR family NAD(P)-dependent oxidoreductase n=1 Tax=Luteococcus sp. TaxID=1969402 RepID=UPI003735DDE9